MALYAPRPATYNIDYVIGVVGGLTAIMFVVTAILELSGVNAIVQALILLGLVIVLLLLWRWRRRILSTAAEAAVAEEAERVS